MATATNKQLPYLEDTGLAENKLYTPKEGLERFRHNIKKIHNIASKNILVDETTPTGERRDAKELEIRPD